MAHRQRSIELRGVRVHNLQGINLDLPLEKLIAITGVSGSGKSSLAFDTLYAEGQRRYVESFPTYSRQFLERLERPAADRIGHLPPAIAVRQRGIGGGHSRRATVGTATEIHDYLRLLFSKIGVVVCPDCGIRVEKHTPASVLETVARLAKGSKFQICFPVHDGSAGSDSRSDDLERTIAAIQRDGFTRGIAQEQTISLTETGIARRLREDQNAMVVVDRLTADGAGTARISDSIELAFGRGGGRCVILAEGADSDIAEAISVDGRKWWIRRFDGRLACSRCGREFLEPVPALFSFNSPLGACPRCQGAGDVRPPDATPRRRGDAEAAVCPDCQGARLRPETLAVQVAGRNIAEWTALSVAEMAAELGSGKIACLRSPDTGLAADPVIGRIVPQIVLRLDWLRNVGLEYLTLDRPARTLSGGESQRVRLTSALGSRLANALFVLDEPTAGLHPRDSEHLVAVLKRLRDMGNTVVVVEHEPAVIREVDFVVDLGPGAGSEGGRVVFQGTPDQLGTCAESVTAKALSEFGRRFVPKSEATLHRPASGWLRLKNVCHRNLDNVSADFPLGVLCVVSGVSGSGKSSLVVETLYPGVQNAFGKRPAAAEVSDAAPSPKPDEVRTSSHRTAPHEFSTRRFESLEGCEQLDAVLLIDPSPVGRSARSNAATHLGIFGEIRALFARTAEAKVRQWTARQFSFNAAGGGRCETCEGTGTIGVDLKFLPDVSMTCPDCHGTRYRPEVLEAKYRGLTIAEVLALPVRDAFAFFRGQTRLQRRLKHLKDLGLDYLALGQAADSLSGGELQRLKLASHLSRGTRSRTLFILEEPTIGLHAADVARLLSSLEQLLAGGHSLIVIEHHPEVIRRADYVVDLGPGAGKAGGRVVVTGAPEDVVRCSASITGRWLRTSQSGPPIAT